MFPMACAPVIKSSLSILRSSPEPQFDDGDYDNSDAGDCGGGDEEEETLMTRAANIFS